MNDENKLIMTTRLEMSRRDGRIAHWVINKLIKSGVVITPEQTQAVLGDLVALDNMPSNFQPHNIPVIDEATLRRLQRESMAACESMPYFVELVNGFFHTKQV